MIDAFRRTTAIRYKLKLVSDSFSLICRSADEINSLFSMPILYLVTTKLITLAISIFIFISQLHNPMENLAFIAWYYMAYTLMDVTIITVIFYAADSPNRQVIIPIHDSIFRVYVQHKMINTRWLRYAKKSRPFRVNNYKETTINCR